MTLQRDQLATDWNLQQDPEAHRCPFHAASKLHSGPDIIFKRGEAHVRSAGLGGNWVVTRQELQAEILRDPDTFSSHLAIGFSRLAADDWPLVPLELDPPEHTRYRHLLTPWFSAAKAREMEPAIRQLCVQLIDEFVDDGQVEFMETFGQRYPVTVFLNMMDLPLDEMPKFLRWEDDLLRGETMEQRGQAAVAIKQYLLALIEERRQKPGDDIVSYILDCKVDDQPIPEDRILGMVFMLFAGGLDTVASSMGFIFRELGTNVSLQQSLRDNPDQIDGAVHEFIRAFGVVTTFRYLTKDTEFHGVAMKKGDLVEIPFGAGSRDERVYPTPHNIDLQRTNTRNITFSTGPHTCLGMHLARMEIRVALEEWLTRVPPFRVTDINQVTAAPESVWTIEKLDLSWGP